MEHFAPTRASARLVSMDAMRGLAIFGIFMVNIQVMAMPFEWMMDPSYAQGTEVWAWGATTALFESNFVAIFSMLFGAGLILQMNSAEKRGASFGPLYLRRLGVLFLMGLLHGTLLFLGDILLLYSVVGLVLFFFRKLQPKTLMMIGAVPLVFALVGAFCLEYFSELLEGLDAGQDPEAEIQEQLTVRQEGPLIDLLVYRGIGFLFWMILSSFWFNWRVMSMLFLGAALMKLGFFEERRAVWHKRAALIGLSLGLGLEVLTTWSSWHGELGLMGGLLAAVHQLSSLGLALGYMGAVALLVHSNSLAWLTGGLTAVGRLSLTNYIMQSVVGNILFTFIGLAWFGERTRWELMGIVCVTFSVQIVLSLIWLRFFRIGPLEWFWRSLTYLKMQPLRRK
ncbi:MAG: DUF418 domain-containing protein [Planctomycetes bacterium]|nr:DUF418 domain-containing protein [Planctomycetota bacterium]